MSLLVREAVYPESLPDPAGAKLHRRQRLNLLKIFCTRNIVLRCFLLLFFKFLILELDASLETYMKVIVSHSGQGEQKKFNFKAGTVKYLKLLRKLHRDAFLG